VYAFNAKELSADEKEMRDAPIDGVAVKDGDISSIGIRFKNDWL
jgi:hypothetical protein